MHKAYCQAYKGALGHTISSGGYRKGSSTPSVTSSREKNNKTNFCGLLEVEDCHWSYLKIAIFTEKKPWRDEVTHSVTLIFMEQMFSPNASKLRQPALKTCRELKDENLSWTVFLCYPAKLYSSSKMKKINLMSMYGLLVYHDLEQHLKT